MTEARPIYSVGHSNQTLEEFLALLRQHRIEVLVDVRSAPYSRFVPHFNSDHLKQVVREAGFLYVYLGRELGGRPDDPALYDAEGHALYGRIAETNMFRDGIERLRVGSTRYRLAMMCSEEDPTDCHRRRLVARVLRQVGVEVLHIRGDGRLDHEEDLPQDIADKPRQSALFADSGCQESDAWKSTRSVLPRNQLGSSSNS
jgi:uncharacterized protein (DUF488 family)